MACNISFRIIFVVVLLGQLKFFDVIALPEQNDSSAQRVLRLAIAQNNLNAVKLLCDLMPAEVSKVFFNAIAEGDLACIKILLTTGININLINEDGATFLHVAASRGDEEVVKLLLDNGADCTIIDKLGEVPLHAACRGGRAGNVALLLQKSPDLLNVKEKRGNTPLHLAAMNKNEKVVNLLLSNKAIADLRNCQGCTPLHLAVYNQNLPAIMSYLRNEYVADIQESFEVDPFINSNFLINPNIIKELIKKCPSAVNEVDHCGNTPLHYAAAYHATSGVKILLENNAAVDIQNIKHRTPLHNASKNNHLGAIILLLAAKADLKKKDVKGLTPLHLAVKCANQKNMFFLIESGAQILAEDLLHYYPFHHALLKGQIKNASWFLSHCSQDYLPDLHEACCHGGMQIVKKILKNKELVNQPDRIGWTALHYAILMKNKELVAELLAHYCANPNISGYHDKRTPLHLAALTGQADIIRLLVNSQSYHLQIDLGDYLQETALHIASRRGDEESVEILLDNGASPHTSNHNNDTPLHLAAKGTVPLIVYKLLAKGAKTDTKNNQGQDSVAIAKMLYNNQQMIRILQSLQSNNATEQNPPIDMNTPQSGINIEHAFHNLSIKGIINPSILNVQYSESGVLALFNACATCKCSEPQYSMNFLSLKNFMEKVCGLMEKKRGRDCNMLKNLSAKDLVMIRDTCCKNCPIAVLDKQQLLLLIKNGPTIADILFKDDSISKHILFDFNKNPGRQIALVVKDNLSKNSWFTIVAQNAADNVNIWVCDPTTQPTDWTFNSVASSILPFYIALSHPVEEWPHVFDNQIINQLWEPSDCLQLVKATQHVITIFNTLNNQFSTVIQAFASLIRRKGLAKSITPFDKTYLYLTRARMLLNVQSAMAALISYEHDNANDRLHNSINSMSISLSEVVSIINSLDANLDSCKNVSNDTNSDLILHAKLIEKYNEVIQLTDDLQNILKELEEVYYPPYRA